MGLVSGTDRCASCGSLLEPLGRIPVRTGGKSGGWILFFGNLAETGEKVLHFDAYRCGECGRLEFFDHDKSLPRS